MDASTARMSFVFVNRPICQMVWRGDRMEKTRNSSKNTMVVKATVRARTASALSCNSRKNTPSVPTVRIAETTKIRKRMSLESTPSLGLRGGRSMMSVGYGSTPSARAGRPSVTRLIQRSCTGAKNGRNLGSPIARIARRPVHDVRRVRVHAERESGQTVRHEVDPEELHRREERKEPGVSDSSDCAAAGP